MKTKITYPKYGDEKIVKFGKYPSLPKFFKFPIKTVLKAVKFSLIFNLHARKIKNKNYKPYYTLFSYYKVLNYKEKFF